MDTSSPSAVSVYEEVDRYPWGSDAEFQGGLRAILGSNPSPEQVAELTLRARCFYYSRKFNTNVDFDQYKAWTQQSHTVASSSEVPPTPSLSSLSSLNGALENATEQLPWTAASAQSQSTSASTEPEAGPKFSYQEIVDMIQSGKPIPGIKEIPNTVLEGQGTTSSRPSRRKPWEKDEQEDTGPMRAEVAASSVQ